MPGRHLIHHLGVFASDFAASDAFSTAALAPLGIGAGYRTDAVAEFWQHGDDTPSVSLETARTPEATTRGLHLALEAGSRSEVDAFHRETVAAGGVSRHEPRYWPEYHAYTAFVSDPDGNNVEALIKESGD
ncbi:VOC family protein [Curtobacterium flaccumfaciens]|uniref:VOC family protein n=1 Tax=Curtobacterium flaccumfaciens TaxID=2035 RepID=UPI00160059FA|nr:VOC family protein [Curtobacterium flaccumfaciens]MBB1198007.1 VOC family protein [Curtobacterium flaccumfaciens]